MLASSLIAEEQVLPAQFRARAWSTLSPERRLLLSVLEQALLELGDGGIVGDTPAARGHRRRREEARAWFAAQGEQGAGGWTFEAVCAHLGFDAAAVRAALDRCGWRVTAGKLVLHTAGSTTRVSAGR